MYKCNTFVWIVSFRNDFFFDLCNQSSNKFNHQSMMIITCVVCALCLLLMMIMIMMKPLSICVCIVNNNHHCNTRQPYIEIMEVSILEFHSLSLSIYLYVGGNCVCSCWPNINIQQLSSPWWWWWWANDDRLTWKNNTEVWLLINKIKNANVM